MKQTYDAGMSNVTCLHAHPFLLDAMPIKADCYENQNGKHNEVPLSPYIVRYKVGAITYGAQRIFAAPTS
jgi:hypothetical protein